MEFWRNKVLTVMLVNGDTLSLVQGTELRIDYYNSIDLPLTGTDDKKWRDQFNKFFPSSRRKQTDEFCLVLPRLMFFTKIIRLPSVDPEELRKMAALQISQHLPYPAEQAVWDLIICQKDGTQSDVLLIAAQLEGVMKYLRILSTAGLTPTIVTVSSDATAAFLTSIGSSSHPVLFTPKERMSEFCFCESEKMSPELSKERKSRFYFSRGIVYGRKDFKTENNKDFLMQVRLTFDAYRKSFSLKQNIPPEGFYVRSFGVDYPDGFWENLNQESGINWKEISTDLFLKSFSSTRQLPLQGLSQDILLGLALIKQGLSCACNFLPRDYRARQLFRSVRKNTAALIVLAIGTILSISFAVTAPVLKKIQYANVLDIKFKEIETPYLQSRKEREIWAAISRGLSDHVRPLDLIEEVYRSLPDGIVFSKISVNSGDELNLEGQAIQSAAVNDLQEKLITSELFKDVRLEHALRRSGPTGEVVQFVIRAKLQDRQELKGQP